MVRRISSSLYVLTTTADASDPSTLARRRVSLLVQRFAADDSATSVAAPRALRRWSLADLN